MLVGGALAGSPLPRAEEGVGVRAPGAMRATREQGAIDRQLAARKRVVEENLFVR
jgi:hypothetical protein